MGSQAIYTMHGFNVSLTDTSCKRKVSLKNNYEYVYKDHEFLETVYIDDDFKRITFKMHSGKEAKHYINKISDELERICFNIIAYSDVETYQPICYLEMITNEDGTNVEINDRISLRDNIRLDINMETSDFYDLIMNKNTPLSDNKAVYKEIFYILHNPHTVIQFIALYDVLLDLICPMNKKNKQKYVSNFFGKNKKRYSFITFYESNENPEKKEDTFTHLRNNIAHSKLAGIEAFSNTANSITNRHIACMLQVINDIVSGEVEVK